MRKYSRDDMATRLVTILLFILALTVMFLLPAGGLAHAVWFWLFMLVSTVLLWALLGRPADDGLPAPTGPRPIVSEEQPDVVRRYMAVDAAVQLPPGIRMFRGRLREDADRTYESLIRAVPPETVPMLQEGADGRTALVLLPRTVEEATLERPVKAWLHWLLFGLTFLTTTFAGAAHQGVNLIREPERFGAGLPYSIALLAILGCHELGHYFTARYHGMRVTPPYFIPVPFALGTFGAFIQMRSPAESRRALFDVAVAGPLAGLAVALPALYFGLKTSTVVPAGASVFEGLRGSMSQASILMSFLVHASLGEPMGARDAIQLSPLAFAGWLGLLITALNLIPVGQLDGGHIARSLFGTRVGGIVSSASMFSLFLLALFVWPGLMMWALFIFFAAGRGTPPLNDVTPLPIGRKLLAACAFVLLALILIPMPEGMSSAQAQHLRCPYL